MTTFETKRKYKKFIFIAGSFFLILLITIFFGFQLRYKYWHFYVHKKLYFFIDNEFVDLLKKYGEENNFASFVQKNKVGVLVTYPFISNQNYSIQLRLVKDIKKDEFLFRAEIASPTKKAHYNIGNPPIYMVIPMKYFKKFLDKGLSKYQIEKLIKTADEVGWKAIELNETIRLKPPIILSFNNN